MYESCLSKNRLINSNICWNNKAEKHNKSITPLILTLKINNFPRMPDPWWIIYISAWRAKSSAWFELQGNKTCFRGFRPGPTQTWLYTYRRWLQAWKFRFRKKRDCSICVAKTKALISCTVTAQLICAFVFAYAQSWFSHDMVHFIIKDETPCTIFKFSCAIHNAFHSILLFDLLYLILSKFRG